MDRPSADSPLFARIGFLVVLFFSIKTLWKIFLFFRVFVLPYFQKSSIDLVSKFGSWAVVTGSSDGIGKAYAIELAKRGVNVVLISNQLKQLEEVAKEIQDNYKVKVKIIEADFSKGQLIFDHIAANLKDVPVGILINNVGMMHGYPAYLTEIPDDVLRNILNVNIRAAVMMTKLVLPEMMRKKAGAIVNISSASVFVPIPLITMYAATKVFIKHFSEAIRLEYSKHGIVVQNVTPFCVNTNMTAFASRLRKSNVLIPDAKTFAHSALNTLGLTDSTTGYWSHEMQYFIINFLPASVCSYIGIKLVSIIRNEYLLEEQKKEK